MDKQELAGLRVAIYARFSSENQRDASLDDQVFLCRQFVQERGGSVPDSLVFKDRAVSGQSMDRPAFNQLRAFVNAAPPTVDVIVTENIDRLGRDEADLHHFKRDCVYAGVRLWSVAGNVDVTSAHGQVAFTMNAMIAQHFLRDLGDKTRRGQMGRARAGYATGGVAYGYRLQKENGPDGKPIGSKVLIDEDQAKVVRRIFRLYLEGHSLANIARRLNDSHVPPPRVHVTNRRTGWKDSTIRAMLHNDTYTGKATYGRRTWRKFPGTNKRRPRVQPDSSVHVLDVPERRIVDADTWEAVQGRLEAVRAHYTKTADGNPKGRSVAGRATPYLFSGLLHCAKCGSKMVVSGGSGYSFYYRCEGHAKRGVCKNALSVREEVVRRHLLKGIRASLLDRGGLEYAREALAKRLGTLQRDQTAGIADGERKVATLSTQVQRLVEAIAGGANAKALQERLGMLDRELEREKKTLARLRRQAAAPVELPHPNDVLRLVFGLEARLAQDVVSGREELRLLFQNGRIDLHPQAEGFYIARSKLLPLTLLATPPSEANLGGRYTASSCAGRI
jgi:site-specific DNA recombinase